MNCTICTHGCLETFSVAFMLTPMHDEPGTFVEPPPELRLRPDVAWRLNQAMYSFRCEAPRCQVHLASLWMNVEFMKRQTTPSFFNSSSGASVVTHVNDPLVCGPRAAVEMFVNGSGQTSERENQPCVWTRGTYFSRCMVLKSQQDSGRNQ